MAPTRRQFLAAAAAVGGAAAVDALGYEPGALRITRHEVPVPGLPAALDGLRVAQLTDVHLRGVHAAARRALEAVARERPEVVVLTGDVCDEASGLAELTAFAREARGALATFATFGNWERWSGIGATELERAYDRAGVELLVNRAAPVERGGARLDFVGL